MPAPIVLLAGHIPSCISPRTKVQQQLTFGILMSTYRLPQKGGGGAGSHRLQPLSSSRCKGMRVAAVLIAAGLASFWGWLSSTGPGPMMSSLAGTQLWLAPDRFVLVMQWHQQSRPDLLLCWPHLAGLIFCRAQYALYACTPSGYEAPNGG